MGYCIRRISLFYRGLRQCLSGSQLYVSPYFAVLACTQFHSVAKVGVQNLLDRIPVIICIQGQGPWVLMLRIKLVRMSLAPSTGSGQALRQVQDCMKKQSFGQSIHLRSQIMLHETHPDPSANLLPSIETVLQFLLNIQTIVLTSSPPAISTTVTEFHQSGASQPV